MQLQVISASTTFSSHENNPQNLAHALGCNMISSAANTPACEESKSEICPENSLGDFWLEKPVVLKERGIDDPIDFSCYYHSVCRSWIYR